MTKKYVYKIYKNIIKSILKLLLVNKASSYIIYTIQFFNKLVL